MTFYRSIVNPDVRARVESVEVESDVSVTYTRYSASCAFRPEVVNTSRERFHRFFELS